MSNSFFNPFERAFARHDLFRGQARIALVWSVVAAVLLFLLLATVFLIISVLQQGGSLELSHEDALALENLVGESRQFSSSNLASRSPTATDSQFGILPAVWYSHFRYWGDLVANLYRQTPMLRTSSTALVLLVVFGVTVGFLRVFVLSQMNSASRASGSEVATRLREAIHRQTLRLGPGDLEEKRTQHALNLFTNDCDSIRGGIATWVRTLLRFPLELLILLIFAFSLHWRVAAQCLIPLAYFWFLIHRERRRFSAMREVSNKQSSTNLQRLAAGLRKTRMVRGYGMEDYESREFGRHVQRFSTTVAAVRHREEWLTWVSRILILLCIALVLYLMGAKMLLPSGSYGHLSPAAALTMILVFLAMQTPLEALWSLPERQRETSDAAARTYQYLDQIPEVGQAVGAKFLQPLSKSLIFESVSYALPNGRMLLDNLDLRLGAGESVALVSLDPLEALAVAHLLPRFIEPKGGRVLFDGEDIAWVTLESLRAETVYVGGDDPFLTGSVLENITCGQADYSLQNATAAAKLVHAHKFILGLPQGYETHLGEHGEELEIGRVFRLGLARAVIRNPALLIVQEPQQTLDNATKTLLDDAYTRIMRDRTVLYLPTRLSTLRRVDRIVLLHQGQVESMGKHETLVHQSPLYRHWEYLHFNQYRLGQSSE